jgi:hypothetical protein
LQWKSDQTSDIKPTKKHDEAARTLASLLGNNNLMLPFRLPNEKELLKDAGVEYLALSNLACSKDILDGVGNCFYPKALTASYTSKQDDGLLEKSKLNIHLPAPSPIPINEAIKEYEILKQTIQETVEKQKKPAEILDKITPHIFPPTLPELASDDFLDNIRTNTVALPKVVENPCTEVIADQEEAQNHAQISYTKNKEATMLEELQQVLDPKILQLISATKFFHTTYFQKLKQPKKNLEPLGIL